MTTEVTISSEGKVQSKLYRNYHIIDDSTIEAMKGYFGVEDYATLFRYLKNIAIESGNQSTHP